MTAPVRPTPMSEDEIRAHLIHATQLILDAGNALSLSGRHDWANPCWDAVDGISRLRAEMWVEQTRPPRKGAE